MLNRIKNGAIALLIILLIFGIGVLVGRYYFVKIDIQVVDKTIYETVYKEKIPTEFNQQNFDLLKSCVNSPIQFKDRTEVNYLFVTAFDDCKEATARYEIGTKGDWRIYAVIAGVGAVVGGYAVYKIIK